MADRGRPKKLDADANDRQKHFARVYIETQNAAEAFRQAYNDSLPSAETARKAKKVKESVGVQAEIRRLRAEIDRKFMVSIADLTKELDENRLLARELGKPEAMNAATMGKAKLHGLITDKRETKHGMADEFIEAMLGDLPDTTGLPSEHKQLPDDDTNDEILH